MFSTDWTRNNEFADYFIFLKGSDDKPKPLRSFLPCATKRYPPRLQGLCLATF